MFLRSFGLLILVLFNIALAHARVNIELWHAMAGPLGTEVERMATQFNQTQTTYKIIPVYKGSYLETLTAYAAAYRAHQPPALVQVFEVGFPTMLQSVGVIDPVEVIMKKYGQDKLINNLWPALKQYYSYNNQLQAFPWNVSLPVMYYNADFLKKFGINSSKDFPKTWQELGVLFQKINKKTKRCIYTSAYPSWIHQESFQALNQEKMHTYPFNQMQEEHFENLLAWNEQDIFQYAGRYDEATVLMASGRCLMFSQSSGAYSSLQSISKFHVGMTSLPVDENAERGNNLVGGAALWVTSGLSNTMQKGIVEWFTFLLDSKNQRQWFAATGYLPIKPLPAEEINSRILKNILKLINKEWGKETSSLPKHQALTHIRSMNDETFEAMLAKLITPKDAWVQMQNNANRADRRFLNNSSRHHPKSD